MHPRLYSISTVCLLKHYNQNYLLHSLRTDFTGSNGVGKSIISDLFQIVFIADTRYIKFATEGIDKKKRKIEKLPYESGIGYAFFNVEVNKGEFIILGAAIFSQGHQLIKPFIITSSIDLQHDKLDLHTFNANKLLFSNSFLKPDGEPYALDELARILPERQNLYLHAFSSKEDRSIYYEWLYKRGVLPINLVKEGNLKAFAKVIQSFSKSKALDIDNSSSLIEYLFEEDEIEISQGYYQQEKNITELLIQFKSTKDQINDIKSKQENLRKLKELQEKKRTLSYKLDYAVYLDAEDKKTGKERLHKSTLKDLEDKRERYSYYVGRHNKFFNIVAQAKGLAQDEQNKYTDLVKQQSIFNILENIDEEIELLSDIDTDGLMHIHKIVDRSVELLQKDARFYKENINGSREVLKRYSTVLAMEQKQHEQDRWLKSALRTLEDKENQIINFQKAILDSSTNSLFVNAFKKHKSFDEAQRATLLHLRTVLINKPEKVEDGIRYTESFDLIKELIITVDNDNKGYWIQTGPLQEFVPATSMIFPDLSTVNFEDIDQLKDHLRNYLNELKSQKNILTQLQNGTIPDGFSDYPFDIDLSDRTKVNAHQLAAELCAVVNHKIQELEKEKRKEIEKIQKAKKAFGITIEDIEYQSLLSKIEILSRILKNRHESLEKKYNEEKTQIENLKTSIPFIEEKINTLSNELMEASNKFDELLHSYRENYRDMPLPTKEILFQSLPAIPMLEKLNTDAIAEYINEYNQIVGRYPETKDNRDIRINEQIRNRTFSFEIIEQSLLGKKIRTLDEVTSYLESLNTDLLTIADDLSNNLVKVFGKTENYYDKYQEVVASLNDFFRGKLISNRFYFQIDFNPAPKLDIKWIEYLRKSASSIAANANNAELSPAHFIEEFYKNYSGNKSYITIEDLLNPKRYFTLKGRLTDDNGKDIPGSTGESYTAVSLLGIARLSVVQDGNRPGLRFIILEESATLDNVNFGMFPTIAKQYGYQILTMTPKPYAIGDDGGWFIHQLIPGKGNQDINYPKVMSYFRTNKSQLELENYLKTRN